MIRLLPKVTYSFHSNLIPDKVAALLQSRVAADRSPRFDRADIRRPFTVEGFEIRRIGWGRTLYNAKLIGRFIPLPNGTRIQVDIFRPATLIYLTIILAIFPTFSVISRTYKMVRDFYTPGSLIDPLSLPGSRIALMLVLFPPALVLIQMILAWLFWPWELKIARRYLNDVLELRESPSVHENI